MQLKKAWEASSLASLMAESWNPLMERLKALVSLRDLTQNGPYAPESLRRPLK